MKKIIFTSIFISAVILLGSVYQASANQTQKYNSLSELPSSCISAYDGCNNCSRSAGGEWACTQRACLVAPTQPAVSCTAYAKTDNKPTMCTMEYAPVCGQKITQCGSSILTPCMPAPATQKTYSNTCMMKADGATLVSEGTCEDSIIRSCPSVPVCGSKTIGKDGTTAVINVTKTYGDACRMSDDGATLAHNGECAATEVTKPPFCSDLDFKKLKRGSRGKNVRALQMHFARIGLIKTENVDGIYGAKLSEAVKRFQRDAGLKQDGIFGNGSRARICIM
jgi:hypothetical protein